MKQIRQGVFEANSSSTHSITIVDKEDFEKWQNGELLFDRDEEKLVPIPEGYMAKSEDLESDDSDEDMEDEDELESYLSWRDFDYLENYVEEFTTKSGDKIVAFGRYGNDNY